MEQELTKSVTGGRTTFRLPSRPERAGHLMVLLQDDSGKVFTASGIKLRAGNLTPSPLMEFTAARNMWPEPCGRDHL